MIHTSVIENAIVLLLLQHAIKWNIRQLSGFETKWIWMNNKHIIRCGSPPKKREGNKFYFAPWFLQKISEYFWEKSAVICCEISPLSDVINGKYQGSNKRSDCAPGRAGAKNHIILHLYIIWMYSYLYITRYLDL